MQHRPLGRRGGRRLESDDPAQRATRREALSGVRSGARRSTDHLDEAPARAHRARLLRAPRVRSAPAARRVRADREGARLLARAAVPRGLGRSLAVARRRTARARRSELRSCNRAHARRCPHRPQAGRRPRRFAPWSGRVGRAAPSHETRAAGIRRVCPECAVRRVVVTGLGVVSPLGLGAQRSFEALLAGRSGISPIERIDVSDLPTNIAGHVPRGSEPGQYDPPRVANVKELRRYDEFILFALAAADEAVTDSGFQPSSEAERERAGVLIGSGIGGLPSIAENAVKLEKEGPRRISPYFIPGSLINEASGVVSIRHGFKGPNHAVVTACATGAHALGDAARLIALGDADVMLAGGTESPVCRISIAGFAACRALATAFNDTPTRASRPYDKNRDGFVMGEGAGACVLEELEHAKRRGARIYGELLGYGLSGDAHHLSAPDPQGDGARRAMSAALQRAQLNPDQIDYINAHATSTPVGDPVEITAVKALFGPHAHSLAMSSTKSATGHLLGAAGAVEAIFTLLALRDGVLPPTLNLHDPDPECDLDLVPREARRKRIRYALSNSFGFGGTNAALVFGPPP